jgi:hypothetical protein
MVTLALGIATPSSSVIFPEIVFCAKVKHRKKHQK